MPKASRITRNTQHRATILHVLAEVDRFISAQELHQRISDQNPPASLATAYRQLGSLAEAGLIDTINAPHGRLFRACRTDYHHHPLVCETCGRTVDILPPDNAWLEAAATAHGYTLTQHSVEAFGQCPECQDTNTSTEHSNPALTPPQER